MAVGGAPIIIPGIVEVVAEAIKGFITAIEHEVQRLQEMEKAGYQYWEAYLVKGVVLVGRGISFWEACIRVSCGFSVMCANQDAARWILVVNHYWGAIGPETHGDEGFFMHYHPHRRTHTHIWYYE